MGLFGKKTDTDSVETKREAARSAVPTLVIPKDVTSVIIKPHITEKAAILTEKDVYTFMVRKGTTKFEVRDAVRALYNVTPRAIRIVNKQPRHFMSRSRGRDMMESGARKAYVYLKKGDRIDLV